MNLHALIIFLACSAGSLGNLIQNSVPQDASASSASQNSYKEALFVYPQGIRSERDIPVCPKWVEKEFPSSKQDYLEGLAFHGHRNPVVDDKLSSPSSLRPDSTKTNETEMRWESACNVVHKRYFYPPVIERLCRCPDRTECPWEWSNPPRYPGAIGQPGSQGHQRRDPFTVMISSRSQSKFCAEVSTALPRCKGNGTTKGHHHMSYEDRSHLIKRVRKTSSGDEIPSVKVNCFCPPLFRQWVYLGKNDTGEFGNGTVETTYFYRCERLQRCDTGQRCGSVRTDFHFTFYHCSCPAKHLCLPKKYPVESVEDIEEDVHEVLFDGQVAPAYCTPFP